MQNLNESSLVDADGHLFIMSLIRKIIFLPNYFQLLRQPKFLKLIDSLQDLELKQSLINQINKFFLCEICGQRLRRFPDSGFVCYKCRTFSFGYHSELNSYARYDCLKCFKVYKSTYFANSICKHLCGCCVYKEIVKGRTSCKICRKNFEFPNAKDECSGCKRSVLVRDMIAIKCGCTYCSVCFAEIKRKKACVVCQGISVSTTEIYQANTRDLEMCFVCEDNKPIVEEFERKECCFIDVCKACQIANGRFVCLGCEGTPR